MTTTENATAVGFKGKARFARAATLDAAHAATHALARCATIVDTIVATEAAISLVVSEQQAIGRERMAATAEAVALESRGSYALAAMLRAHADTLAEQQSTLIAQVSGLHAGYLSADDLELVNA